MKWAVIHEGWERRQGRDGREDYRLVNPTFLPVVEGDAEAFWETVRGELSARYVDVDRMWVIVNGDGEEWIGQGVEPFARVLYPYDRFHAVQVLREGLRGAEERQVRALAALEADDIDELIREVEGAFREAREEKERGQRRQLREWVERNREALVDYRKRLRALGVEGSPTWRGLGAAESNVNKVKARIGKQGRAGSLKGLGAILTALAEPFEGKLGQRVERTAKELEETRVERVRQGAGHVARKLLKAEGWVRRGRFPALERGTEGFAFLFREVLEVPLP